MHKKIAADLTSLAHDILQIKNKEDVFSLKTKAHEVYEKLVVLAHIEESISATPNPDDTKEELLKLVKNLEEKETAVKKHHTKDDALKVRAKKMVLNASLDTTPNKGYDSKRVLRSNKEAFLTEDKLQLTCNDSSFDSINALEKEDLQPKSSRKTTEREKVIEKETLRTLEEELKDTIALDVVADLFENAHKKSLNDTMRGDLQIGLNDRIAFVKNLFNDRQEDFKRVMSQLNTFKTEKEAKNFIMQFVKPNYDWTEKGEIEARFMAIIEGKFL